MQQLYALLDVRLGREVGRVAADVGRVRVLVHTHPVDAHLRGEGEVLIVDEAELLRDTEVNEDVLHGGGSALLCSRVGGHESEHSPGAPEVPAGR